MGRRKMRTKTSPAPGVGTGRSATAMPLAGSVCDPYCLISTALYVFDIASLRPVLGVVATEGVRAQAVFE